MKPRMNNPSMIVPGAMAALQKLGAAARAVGVPETTLYLVEVRASQMMRQRWFTPVRLLVAHLTRW